MDCPSCAFNNPTGVRFCGNCGAPLPEGGGRGTRTAETALVKELVTGTTFAGRYRVIEELGKGGMGRVYKVFDEKIKEKVALKLLKPEISTDAQAIERFSNELRLSRKISHRHVCRMFDLGEVDGTHYITMEYVPGEDLKSILRMMGPLSAGKVVLVARQVCQGLAEAHRLGVVHRDLKPQNIMVDREGNVRIMDFGIARSLKVKGMTGAGMVVGTPEYMSPEQVEGKEVDNRSDIYSLGIILYEMMTGRVPFEGETFLSIAVKQKTEAPRNPREVNPQIPEDLNRLVLRCLQKSPEKRYQRVEDIQADLARIEKGIPTTEKILPSVKPSTSREITVKLRPRKLILPAAALAVLAVAVVFGLRLLSHKKAALAATGKPSLAVMYFENNTGDPGLDHWRQALPELLITDLSQSKYVNVLSGDQMFEILGELNQAEAKTYSAKTLREVAARGGVNHILLGGLTKAGDSFRLNYMIKRFGRGETVGAGWLAGRGLESFYSMVDSLTLKVKEDLKLTPTEIAGDVDAELGKITTSSPEAFALYVEGRNYHNQGDYARSIELMKKALAIDPDFAMAYRSMAVSYGNSFLSGEARRCLEKAMSLRDRVSEKERFLLEGDFYQGREETVPKGIEAYTALLRIYPDDAFAQTKLSYVYDVYELYDQCIEHARLAIQSGDRSYYPVSYMASAYNALGQPEKAREVLEAYLREVGESAPIRDELADHYARHGRYAEAFDQLDRALVLNPDSPLLLYDRGRFLLYQGNLTESGSEFRRLLERQNSAGPLYGLYGLCQLAFLRGRFVEAKDLANQALSILAKLKEEDFVNVFRDVAGYALWRSGRSSEALDFYRRIHQSGLDMDSLNWPRKALLSRGLILADQGSFPQAEAASRELAGLCRSALDPQDHLLPEVLQGAIELREGNARAAVESLKPACDRLFQENGWLGAWHALYYERLAEALERAGSLDEARREYEKITALTDGRFAFGDIYTRSFYNLGRLHERRGNGAKAAENYRKFLDLWKEADPGLPEVADARKRLAALQGA
jgi:serine/threonine protein kinase/Tfp pilus assembly protein PilF